MIVTKDNLIDMLLGEWALYRWTDKLQKLGIDLDIGNAIDARRTSDIILDILGYPNDGDQKDEMDEEGFCRDWYLQGMVEFPSDPKDDRDEALTIIDTLIDETKGGKITSGKIEYKLKV